MKAILVDANSKRLFVGTAQKLTISAGELLVKVKATL